MYVEVITRHMWHSHIEMFGVLCTIFLYCILQIANSCGPDNSKQTSIMFDSLQADRFSLSEQIRK